MVEFIKEYLGLYRKKKAIEADMEQLKLKNDCNARGR